MFVGGFLFKCGGDRGAIKGKARACARVRGGAIGGRVQGGEGVQGCRVAG